MELWPLEFDGWRAAWERGGCEKERGEKAEHRRNVDEASGRRVKKCSRQFCWSAGCVLHDRLAFGVGRWVFEVWPAAGASGFTKTIQMSERRCAGPNFQHQTPRSDPPKNRTNSLHDSARLANGRRCGRLSARDETPFPPARSCRRCRGASAARSRRARGYFARGGPAGPAGTAGEGTAGAAWSAGIPPAAGAGGGAVFCGGPAAGAA